MKGGWNTRLQQHC